MNVGGYLIQPKNIPTFWYCWAHWVNFQKYAYQLLVTNDISNKVFMVIFVFPLDSLSIAQTYVRAIFAVSRDCHRWMHVLFPKLTYRQGLMCGIWEGRLDGALPFCMGFFEG
jgi:hypothetical protein